MGSDVLTQLNNSDSFCFHKKLWKNVLSISQLLLTFCRKMVKPWETLVDDTDSHRQFVCSMVSCKSSGCLGWLPTPKESCEMRVNRSGKQCRLMKSVQPSVLNTPVIPVRLYQCATCVGYKLPAACCLSPSPGSSGIPGKQTKAFPAPDSLQQSPQPGASC